jgi:hypothetical protein
LTPNQRALSLSLSLSVRVLLAGWRLKMKLTFFLAVCVAQIRCRKDQSCSGRTETVIITDMNYYPVAPFHFDLSGTAFGRLAKPGLNDKLRHSGIIDIEFTR